MLLTLNERLYIYIYIHVHELRTDGFDFEDESESALTDRPSVLAAAASQLNSVQ